MISITLSNIKNCMAQLLLKETFHNFLFIEGEIVTANTFKLDGFIQKRFFESELENIPDYSSWKEMQELCFSIIKGKRTPLSFKFIFSLSPSDVQTLITDANLDMNQEEVQGLYMNLRFDGEHLLCITGTSFKSFSLDKTLEKIWDTYVQDYFAKNSIEFTLNE